MPTPKTKTRRPKQLSFLDKAQNPYGSDLMKKRAGRPKGGRPLAVKSSMHLILRSSKAVKEWSFTNPVHKKAIQKIIDKFSNKYGIRIYSFANVGNHLHFHIQLSVRRSYEPFIRAITAAIAMAVTGASRWNKPKKKLRFWDARPFTRIVETYRHFLTLKDYIQINQWEGIGVPRVVARDLVHPGTWFLKNQKLLV